MAARFLKDAGKTVALVEARRVVEGVTGHTTAKVTSLHTLIYVGAHRKVRGGLGAPLRGVN